MEGMVRQEYREPETNFGRIRIRQISAAFASEAPSIAAADNYELADAFGSYSSLYSQESARYPFSPRPPSFATFARSRLTAILNHVYTVAFIAFQLQLAEAARTLIPGPPDGPED